MARGEISTCNPRSLHCRSAVQRYFEVALYLLVAVRFRNAGFDRRPGCCRRFCWLSAALLFRGYLLATHRTLLIPESWTTTLTLGLRGFLSGGLLRVLRCVLSAATVHLVLFVMVVRLFSAKRDRDYYFLAVISFLMVLAAAVLTVDSTFLLAFAAFHADGGGDLHPDGDAARRRQGNALRANSSSDDSAYRQMAFLWLALRPCLRS